MVILVTIRLKKLPIRTRKIIKKEARIRNDYIQNILPDQILEEKNKIDFSFNHNDEIESSKPFIIENLNNHNSYLSENKYFTFLNIKLNLVEKFYKESFIKLDDICKNQVNQSESKNYRFFPIVKNNVASIIVDKYHNYMTAPLKKIMKVSKNISTVITHFVMDTVINTTLKILKLN